MAIGWVVIDVPMDDRTLYGVQTRNRSYLKGHVGSLRGSLSQRRASFDPFRPRHNNATHAMQGSVQAFPIEATSAHAFFATPCDHMASLSEWQRFASWLMPLHRLDDQGLMQHQALQGTKGPLQPSDFRPHQPLRSVHRRTPRRIPSTRPAGFMPRGKFWGALR